MDLKLLDEARQRRDAARRRVLIARAEIDEAETEYHRLDEALATIESIRREQEDFTRDALGD